MDTKEFFKARTKKIVIMIVLIALIVILGMIRGYNLPIGCKGWSCYGIWLQIVTVLLYVFAIPLFILDKLLVGVKMTAVLTLSLLIVELAYLYLLSCIITYFWKKPEKKDNI